MKNKTALEICSQGVRAWVAAALCVAACGSPVNRGAEFYTHGRYIDAALVFEHTEDSLQSYSEAERARYGLYRGATLLALGYANDARHWFNYGSALAQHSLEEGERSALFDALLPAHVRSGPSTRQPEFGTKAVSVKVATRHPAPETAPAAERQTTQPPTLVTP